MSFAGDLDAFQGSDIEQADAFPTAASAPMIGDQNFELHSSLADNCSGPSRPAWLRTMCVAHSRKLRGRSHRVPAGAGRNHCAEGTWRFHGLQRVQSVYTSTILRTAFFDMQ